MNWLVFKILSQKKYFLTFAILSILMAVIYVLIQVVPEGLNNFWFWFSLLKPWDWLFYVVFCLLFGINFALFSWRNDFKVCSSGQKIKTGIFGGLGAFFSTFLPICPQCLSFLGLVLPIGFLGFLIQYRSLILGTSVFLMITSLFVLGAFDNN